MRVTKDRFGRLVIPREIRRRLGLSGGELLEISEQNGTIELRRPTRDVALVRDPGGLLHADPSAELPGMDSEQTRERLEAARERRA